MALLVFRHSEMSTRRSLETSYAVVPYRLRHTKKVMSSGHVVLVHREILLHVFFFGFFSKYGIRVITLT